MPKSSIEELEGRIAAGQYAVDARVLAGDILSKVRLIRRVKTLLLGEDEESTTKDAGPGAQLRRQRGSTPAAGDRRSHAANDFRT